jgi:DNA-directed RNA polymerase specialized sigma24 family protein
LKSLSDKKLIELIKNKDSDAEFELYRRYKDFSNVLGKFYSYKYGKNCGITEDEFVAVCFECLPEAIKTYKGISKTFKSYWKFIVRNAIIDYLHANSYYGKMRHLGEVSFDDYVFDDEVETKHNTIGTEDDLFSYQDLIKEIKEIIDDKSNGFTKDESIACYYMFILQNEVDEISKLTKWSIHKTYKVCKSGKDKLAVIIKNRYFK